MKGKVQTVLGLVDPNDLGAILPHEHLIHDLPKNTFRLPLPETLSHIQGELFTLETFGCIQRFPYSFPPNNVFDDNAVRTAVKEEMHFFKKFGGGTIVDNGSYGIRTQDQPQFLRTVSKETGVHIVAGTGFYVKGTQTSSVLKMSQEEMEEVMRKDILVGADDSDIKCGVIGEIGTSWPVEEFEKRSLASSATVQQETGCPVIIHPGRDMKAPEEVIRIFQEAGGNVRQAVMSHLDRTFTSKEDLAEFAALGSFCEFDLFGLEVSHYQLNQDFDMPSDAQRIKLLFHLVQEGYLNRIVMSHDMHTKHRLMKFGGHGYSHILMNVVPKMLIRGFTEEDVKRIVCDNPREWLTFQ